MSVTILIPTPLRPYAGNQDNVQLDVVDTVGTLLSNLVETHSKLKQNLYDDAGNLRKFVNIYLNDEDIRFQEGEKTKVNDNDVISIVPSIAGGV